MDKMKTDQKSIYYITGENEESLRNSPLLEMYNSKDVEVLIMADPFDEIIIPSKNKHLYALNLNGVLFDFEAGQFLMGTPAIGNLDEDDLEIPAFLRRQKN